MPRVGCDAKPTKTRPAPIITRQARVTDPLMVQCWYSFYDAGTELTHQWVNVSCFLRTHWYRTVEAAFLQLFYFTAFCNIGAYITASDD